MVVESDGANPSLDLSGLSSAFGWCTSDVKGPIAIEIEIEIEQTSAPNLKLKVSFDEETGEYSVTTDNDVQIMRSR